MRHKGGWVIRNVDSQMDEIHINIRKETERVKEVGTDCDAFRIYLTNAIFFKDSKLFFFFFLLNKDSKLLVWVHTLVLE